MHDRPLSSAGPTTSPRKPKILVAEDDDDIRSVLEMILDDRFEIRCEATAARAVAMAESWGPDVVLLDWTLPDGTGADVVRCLRAMTRFSDLPFVLLSGAPTLTTLAADIGAVPCAKPCDVDQLTAAIDLALMRRP